MMQKNNKIKQLKYYDVKVDTLLNSTITFRVLAEDENQAIELIKKHTPVGVKYKLIGRKDKKITVYEAGSSIIKFIKNLIS